MESRRARRRVPQELRKRAQLSCDSCRKRRCRCVRSQESEVCVACQQSGLECRSTFCPKTRLYGSVETVSDRMRCLDAIVSASFPDEPTSSISDLLALGQKKGYHMPDVSTLATIRDPTSLNEDSQEAFMLDSSRSNANRNPTGPSSESRNASDEFQYMADKPRLIQDTAGRSHYIGPSGSLSFFAELRQLISTKQPASRFASDNLAEALEARPESDTTDTPVAENVISSPSSVSSAMESLRLAGYLRSIPFRVLLDLLQLFFDRIHSDFPLFHRGLFLDRFERFFLYNHGERAGNVGVSIHDIQHDAWDDGWLICLHMMIAFGCILRRATGRGNQHEVGVDFHEIQRECWSIARSALGRITTMCVQSHVQALLLIALYLHGISERNAAWVLVGCSARIGIALGLHRTELHDSFSLIERETRKRIWCTLYGFEQFLCLSLGRPSAIDDEEVKAGVPSDEIMSSGTGPPGCTEFEFYLHQLCPKLCKTMSTRHRSLDGQGLGIYTTTNTVLRDLSTWEANLPSHLHLPKGLVEQKMPSQADVSRLQQFPSHHLRNLILLHIQYNELALAATRPYLLMTISISFKGKYNAHYPWDASDATVPSPSHQIWKFARTCVTSASRIATLTLILDHLNLLDGLIWLDVYYSYSAAMVLLLRVLWVPGSGTSHDIVRMEKSCRDSAIQVVTAVRKALRRVNKCPSMHRFFSVLERFAEVVTNSVLPTMQQQIGLLENEPHFEQSPRNSSTNEESSVQWNSSQNTRRINGYTTSTQQQVSNNTSFNGDSMQQSRASIYQENIHPNPYAENSGLTEAASAISSLSQDSMYAETISWDYPVDSVTQHILDWNNFEQFLGRWSSG